ncbi:MAG: signal peptidase I [Planctomycetes bacterium]|nr:signal peptidase I [Planctomycetota bacterium]
MAEEQGGGAASTTTRPRAVAGLLSFFLPGLGQLYCGRPLRALLLFAGEIAICVATLLAFARIRSQPVNLAAPALYLAWRIGLCADAVRLARRAFRPRWFESLPAQVAILLLCILVAVPRIALLLRDHVAEAFRVPSRSMSDTLLPGDRFLVDKLARFEPARGDVVVYWTEPDGAPVRFVHRVIGLPGERVEVRGSTAIIDGRGIEEPYVKRDGGYSAPDFGPVVVPAGHFFLLGDWRDMSRDSRQPEVGFVSRERIVARAAAVFFSADPETGDVRWPRIGHVIR